MTQIIDTINNYVSVQFRDIQTKQLIGYKSIRVEQLKKKHPRGREFFAVEDWEFLLPYGWTKACATPEVWVEPHPSGGWMLSDRQPGHTPR